MSGEEKDAKYRRIREGMTLFEKREKDLIEKWNKYQRLTNRQKSDLKVAWDRYYVKAKDTFACKNYFKQLKAYETGDMATVKECQKDAKRIMKEGAYQLKQPSSIDPEEMARRMRSYLETQEFLTGRSNPYVETKDVFGAKAKEEDKMYNVVKEMF